MKPKNRKEKTPANTVTSKRLTYAMLTMFIVLFALLLRIGYLQFIKGSYLKEEAFQQQTVSKLINPKRGNILDCNGNLLAGTKIKYSIKLYKSK